MLLVVRFICGKFFFFFSLFFLSFLIHIYLPGFGGPKSLLQNSFEIQRGGMPPRAMGVGGGLFEEEEDFQEGIQKFQCLLVGKKAL